MRYLFIILLSVPLRLTGQQLVSIDELNFHSDVEEQAIRDHAAGITDHFALFTCVDGKVDMQTLVAYRKRYQEGLSQVNMNKLVRKKPQVRIDRIYGEIHDEFFNSYREKNYFRQIFEDGIYNCVSATAFYGMVFQDLGIPFTVRENPTHVYLVAYPENEKIMVESTAPGLGQTLYPESFKRVFIKELLDNKIIPEEESRENNLNDLFDRYYFNDDNIDLVQLVGIQYLNDAIYRLENDDHTSAFEQAQKAWIFYPSQKSAFMMMNLGMLKLGNGDYYKDPKMVDMFIFLSRFREFGVKNEMVLGEFGRILESVLIKNSDEARMEELYSRIMDEIRDPVLRNEIGFAYNYERARILYNLGRFHESLPFVEQASEINPMHMHAKGLLSSCIIQLADSEPDPLQRSQFLDQKISAFPSLKESSSIISLNASSCLEQSTRNFKMNLANSGNKWLERFEDYYNGNLELNISTSHITEAYSSAAVYYFRKGNRPKAVEFLERGLKVSPGNYELEQRLRMIR